MKGLVASITSCIGGKKDKFTVCVKPLEQDRYFVYKTFTDFQVLWQALEQLIHEQQRRFMYRRTDGSLMTKWLIRFTSQYSLRKGLEKICTEHNDVMSMLNTCLNLLVRRVSALYIDNKAFRNGCCRISRKVGTLIRDFLEFSKHDVSMITTPPAISFNRKRTFSEMRPEDSSKATHAVASSVFPVGSSIFPIGSSSIFPVGGHREDGASKIRKLSGTGEDFRHALFPRKSLDCPAVIPRVASRTRAFAEVEFGVM